MVRQTANRFHKISEYASALSAFKEPDQNELKKTLTIDDMLLNYGSKNDFEGGDAKENVEKEEKVIEKLTDFIVNRAQNFEGALFTIQRICELLTWPDKHYNSAAKFLRALEKTFNVVTCVMPDGQRTADANAADDEMDEDEPTAKIENTFIVQVDELDAPLPRVNGNGTSNLSNSKIAKTSDSTSKERFEFTAPELNVRANTNTTDFATSSKPLGPMLPPSVLRGSPTKEKTET
ncbi:hypothetical protein M3Y96_00940400 [Aphelenchoides besseyi]|nr:hypothetical protein M3Y96_00940400 [Aphelenchoides besseyi]